MFEELKLFVKKYRISEMTESLIAAQAFIFFAAGFETSSTTMSNALYELALNQQIQDKLREEIDQEYTKHGSNLTYENVKRWNYFDKVLKDIKLKKKKFNNLLLIFSTIIVSRI